VLHGHALPALALLVALVVAGRGRAPGLLPVALVLTAALLLIAALGAVGQARASDRAVWTDIDSDAPGSGR
ncbi:MAG TPA: hypothetical protein PKC49_09895, partial [Phycisphaerae bacterium]|nr:hypothetical protein [Phycisphaerae bacterium]